jgi:hypothetical protein
MADATTDTETEGDQENEQTKPESTPSDSGNSGDSETQKSIRSIVREELSALRTSGGKGSSTESIRAKEDRIAAEVEAESKSVLGELKEAAGVLKQVVEKTPVKPRWITKMFGWNDPQ